MKDVAIFLGIILKHNNIKIVYSKLHVDIWRTLLEEIEMINNSCTNYVTNFPWKSKYRVYIEKWAICNKNGLFGKCEIKFNIDIRLNLHLTKELILS